MEKTQKSERNILANTGISNLTTFNFLFYKDGNVNSEAYILQSFARCELEDDIFELSSAAELKYSPLTK